MLLNEYQCGLLLKSLRAFGYPKLTLATVMSAAKSVSERTHDDTNVIHVFVDRQVEECEAELAGRRR